MDDTRPLMRPPGARAGPRTRGAVLFRHAGVLVTDEWLVVSGRRYPINELSRPRTVRGPHDPLTVRAMALAAIVVAVLGVVLAAATAQEQPPAGAFLAAGGVVTVPLLVALAGHRMRPRPFELWAEFRGLTVQLYRSENEREYNQICRALVRARELARLGPAHDPWPVLDPWHSLPR